MTEERLAALSIGQLKAVLRQNHVNTRYLVEKGDLVIKVRTLIEDERAERERKLRDEEAERAAEMGWESVPTEDVHAPEAEMMEEVTEDNEDNEDQYHEEAMDVDNTHTSAQEGKCLFYMM